jgi:signal transduction histidine kinase/CheY-like chemotaxis protein/HAMP domain-containing protein
MTIRKRVILITILCFATIVAAGVILVLIGDASTKAYEAESRIAKVRNSLYDLNIITSDYLLFFDERPQQQWAAKNLELQHRLHDMQNLTSGISDESNETAILVENHHKLSGLFEKLRDVVDTDKSERNDTKESVLIKNELSAQLLLRSRKMLEIIKLLLDEQHKKQEMLHQRQGYLTWSVIAVLVSLLSGFLFWTRSAVLKPLALLQKGTKEIARGNYSRQISINTKDELQSLAHSFNEMTGAVEKNVTKLNEEINERKRAEEELTGYRNRLEELVRERTVKLRDVNEQLQADIIMRKQAEEALKESETRFKELFKNMHSGVAVYEATADGEDFIFKDFNRVAEQIEGTKKEQLIGKSVLKVFPGVRDCGLFDVFQRVWKSGRPERFPVTLYQDDRIAGWRENFVYKLPSGEIVAIYTDETEHKQAEEKRKELEAQLQQVQKMESIGTLAGGIAHDFNNMLGIIVGNTELAMDDVSEWNPARNNLEEIRTASMRARDVVKQILAFSRQSPQELKPIRISPIIRESLKLLRSSIPKSIEIIQDIASEDDIVLADPTRINQVVINLCTNAAHALRDKGGILEVSLEKIELDKEAAIRFHYLKAGKYVRLTVNDTGQGMEPEVMERIFEPYFTTKEVGEGSGMGLSVVHGIVKTLGGGIRVDSELGQGTTFQVFFPYTESKPEPEIEIAGKIPRGNESILFVDDEKAMVDAIRPMIERLGYEVTARTSSIEALEAFSANPDRFDLVITDFTMPNLNGMELAKKLYKLRSDIPVILCTGYSELINEEKAKGNGILAFVMKPVVLGEIANAVRKVLDQEKG